MLEIPIHPLTERFAWLIAWFTKMMAAEAYHRPAGGLLAGATWNYMHRQGRRFAVLVAQWQAGTLPTPRPPRPRASTPRIRKPIQSGLRGVNWFRKLFPDTAPPLGGALHALVCNVPDTALLVAAAPQAGRILRPLCRMVGLALPPYLQLPRRPRRPQSIRARPAPKPRPPRPVNINRLSSVAYGNLVNPEREPMGPRPPNRIGYARMRRWPKRE